MQPGRLRKLGEWFWGRARWLCAAARRAAADVGGGPYRCVAAERMESRELFSAGWDVALIDRSLPTDGLLARAMAPGGRVILYDGRTESPNEVLGRVVDWAKAAGGKVESLSLLSHASAGRFALGNDWVSRNSLKRTAKSWRQLGRVMADGGSVNLYGCNLVDPSGDGQVLIDKVARLTGANIFASTNVTGNGGDWVLEAASRKTDFGGGAVPHTGTFNAAELIGWGGTLAAPAGGEFRANTTTVNAQFTEPQSPRAVATDTAGNFVVAWTDELQDGTGYGVYSQRFNADGTPNGGEFLVNTTTNTDEHTAVVAMAPDGRCGGASRVQRRAGPSVLIGQEHRRSEIPKSEISDRTRQR